MPTNNFSAIPLELRQCNQWILWRYEDKGGAKPTKVPYAKDGYLASVTDPRSWCSFDTAISLSNNYDGIGFVFTDNDPFAFIDLDHTNDKADYERQLRVSKEFNSYSEVSPSGQGLHIIVRGSIPQGRKRSSIEIYSSGRYATMTGNIYESKPIADRHELLNQLFMQMGGPATTHSLVDEPQREEDDKIIDTALNAANGTKFRDLYYGEWQSYYPTQSEADFALIDIISFYTQHRTQIERIFKKSQLGKRDKANRKDYLGWMINQSFDRQLPKLDFEGWKINVEKHLSNSFNNSIADINAEVYNADQLALPLNGPVVQLVEPAAHNGQVASSNLAGTTIQPPPGLVGEIAQFIYSTAPRPIPEVAIAGAMGLMAGICGKAYNISGTGLNQYILLLARTGSGKEAMAYGIDKLINAVQMSVPVAAEFIGPSEIQSGQALIKNLSENPSYVSILGEFSWRLKAMSSDRANTAEIGLRRMILDLYHKSGYGQSIRPTIYSDKAKNIATIQAPAFSIVGESVPDKFYELLTEDMIAEGLLPRFMIIEYNGGRPAFNEQSATIQPSIALVEKVAQLMANVKTIIANRKVINVEQTPEAEKMLKEFDKYADAKMNALSQDVLLHLWNRAHIKALKIAALIACGQNIFQPTINEVDAKWAIDVALHDIHALSDKFLRGVIGKSSEENKQLDIVVKMIKSFITDDFEKMKGYNIDQRLYSARVIPYVYLNRRTLNNTAFKNDKVGATNALKRAIQTLVDSDTIREAPKKEMQDRFGTTQKAFMITNMGIFGNSPESS